MTKVMIGEHRWVNVSRRCLCDNCIADVCFRKDGSHKTRIERCDLFRSPFVAFKKCVDCGSIYDLFSNLASLDFDKCPQCNQHEILMEEEFGN